MIDYKPKIVRADAILTTSYVAGIEVVDLEKSNQLMIYLKYTKGSLTSFQLKIEFSDDGSNYYQQTSESLSAGVSTATPKSFTFAPTSDQNYVLEIPIKCSKVKISVKGTGTVTASSLQVRAINGVS